MYDLAYGPPNPRSARKRYSQSREWEDPFAWVDLLQSARSQVELNVAHASQHAKWTSRAHHAIDKSTNEDDERKRFRRAALAAAS